MSRDLELRLQTYANSLVDSHLQREYNIQLSKWKKHVNRVGGAYFTAVTQHNTVLKAARDKQQADNELTMAALSFVGGLAMSWISGYLQYRLSPRFFDMTPRYVFSRDSQGLLTDGFKSFPHEYVHIFGHIFGELPKEIVEFGADLTIKTDPRENGIGSALAGLAVSANPEIFKMNLENALEEESQKTTKSIGGLAMTILNSQDYGKACLKRLHRLQPHSVKANPDMQEVLAKKMIVDDLDRQRRQLAKQWFYYGNDPLQENLYDMSDKIETEIWASWILDQDFGDPRPTDWGRDGIELDSIYDRLVDLDIAIARTDEQRLPQMSRVIDNPNKGIPVTDVDDDDPYKRKEVLAFTEWAANHHPDPIGGSRGAVPRIMGSILDIYKQP